MESSLSRRMRMSVMIFRARKRLSLSYAASCDCGPKLWLDRLALERRTGRRKEMMASCIYRMTFWLVEMLSAISSRVYWNS